MADRVYPRVDSPPTSGEAPLRPSQPPHEKPVPPPGTYVVQIPKDQIYRYPPPENARKFEKFSRQKPRRSSCCRCFCWTLALAATLLLLLAIAAGVLYLVYRPEPPKYSVAGVSIRGINVTSGSPAISPAFDVTVGANNPNDKIGFYYEKGSSVEVYYAGVKLAGGEFPAFFQPANNMTVVRSALRGSDIVLTSSDRSSLKRDQKRGKVPLRLNVKAPVRIKIGGVKTWTVTVKVKCDVTVDKLTTSSKVVSKRCKYSVKPW